LTKTNKMSVIYFLIGCSILLAVGFLLAFLWSINSGQNDDVDTPAIRMLFDDELTNKDKTENT